MSAALREQIDSPAGRKEGGATRQRRALFLAALLVLCVPVSCVELAELTELDNYLQMAASHTLTSFEAVHLTHHPPSRVVLHTIKNYLGMGTNHLFGLWLNDLAHNPHEYGPEEPDPWIHDWESHGYAAIAHPEGPHKIMLKPTTFLEEPTDPYSPAFLETRSVQGSDDLDARLAKALEQEAASLAASNPALAPQQRSQFTLRQRAPRHRTLQPRHGVRKHGVRGGLHRATNGARNKAVPLKPQLRFASNGTAPTEAAAPPGGNPAGTEDPPASHAPGTDLPKPMPAGAHADAASNDTPGKRDLASPCLASPCTHCIYVWIDIRTGGAMSRMSCRPPQMTPSLAAGYSRGHVP